ncbi:MAG: hypothetical protein HY078_07390 [Elusimicrobia bacterium]|nr:hypothetical protein [Elusimicrobiota bacterium]
MFRSARLLAAAAALALAPTPAELAARQGPDDSTAPAPATRCTGRDEALVEGRCVHRERLDCSDPTTADGCVAQPGDEAGATPSSPRPAPLTAPDGRRIQVVPVQSQPPRPRRPPNVAPSRGSVTARLNLLSQALDRWSTTGRRHAGRADPSARLTDPVVRIDWFSGYFDVENRTEDAVERHALRGLLQRRCDGRHSVCGFRMTQSNGVFDTFERTVRRRNGSTQRFVTRLFHSSQTDDNAANSTSREQRERSERIRQEFRDALAGNAHMVIYSGHSRLGGGPDFQPPRLHKNHVDYPWYVRNRPGFNLMTNALRERVTPLFFLGLFSCDSLQHFAGGIGRRNVQHALVSEIPIANEGYYHSLASIDSVIATGYVPRIRDGVMRVLNSTELSRFGRRDIMRAFGRLIRRRRTTEPGPHGP